MGDLYGTRGMQMGDLYGVQRRLDGGFTEYKGDE
jgi:hypothetical protein